MIDGLSFFAGALFGFGLAVLIVGYTIYSIKVYMKKTGIKWGDKPVRYDPYGKK